jgi:hypothetical protein
MTKENMQEVVEKEVTNLFRSLTMRYGIATSQFAYEYTGGELWYRGNPIENSMTENERRCLEHAVGEVLNRRLTCTSVLRHTLS